MNAKPGSVYRFPCAIKAGIPISFTLIGKPAPKGNSRQVWRAGKRLRFAPDARYLAWLECCRLQINRIMADTRSIVSFPIAVPVRVTATFYRDRRADADNLAKGTGDLLQACGVLKNDRLIRAWSIEVRPPEGNPRVEIEIVAMGEG